MTVIFQPQLAGEATATAYCVVNGREERLVLRLQGKGLGPKATWLYDTLDIGDIFINSQHRYEVVLENHGEISADYELRLPDSLFAGKFTFTPMQACWELGLGGRMGVGARAWVGSLALTLTDAGPSRAQGECAHRGALLLGCPGRVPGDLRGTARRTARAAAPHPQGPRGRALLPTLTL